jgi:hydrogenase nickel incorporation protein HypA/HybF
MHELAIAQTLIETATAMLPAGISQINVLYVQLGALAGVSNEELQFGFSAVATETACAAARLEIVEIPAVIHCPQCGVESVLAEGEYPLCPRCGTPAVQVIQGKELIITSIEAEVEVETEVETEVDIEANNEAVYG